MRERQYDLSGAVAHNNYQSISLTFPPKHKLDTLPTSGTRFEYEGKLFRVSVVLADSKRIYISAYRVYRNSLFESTGYPL